MAEASGQEVSSSCCSTPSQVTPPWLFFLSHQPFHIRLRCGAFPSREEAAPRLRWLAESAVRLLSLQRWPTG